MKPIRVLGIMSGTSIDGVDYALCSVSAAGVRLRKLWSVKFPAALRSRLHRSACGEASSHELAQLHHDLGRFYARHARRGSGQSKPQLVGLHGQTVYHHPHLKNPATLQIGESAYLVEELRVPVVSNFRAADLAAGGQGAPLASLFHQVAFGQPGCHVCVNNLGGISNVTSLDWTKGTKPAVLAFDTGPANVLIDLAIRHYTNERQSMDTHGAWAARGVASEALLAAWLKHPYFKQPPPKSTGREVFGEVFWRRVQPQIQRTRLSRFDVLATLTEFTARSLALNYQLHLPNLPETLVLTGGGAANPTLVRVIRARMAALNPAMQVVTSEALGWPARAIEPAAFALLAWRRMRSEPANLPATTGARRAAVLGQVSVP